MSLRSAFRIKAQSGIIHGNDANRIVFDFLAVTLKLRYNRRNAVAIIGSLKPRQQRSNSIAALAPTGLVQRNTDHVAATGLGDTLAFLRRMIRIPFGRSRNVRRHNAPI